MRTGEGFWLLLVLLHGRHVAAGELPDLRYFVAGGVSAALSHGYTTPIDVRRHHHRHRLPANLRSPRRTEPRVRRS